MQRTGQTLPRQAPRRPSRVPAHPSLNRRCNTRECLAILAQRSIRSSDVIETLAGLMTARGVPEHIRSDNSPEFTARAIRKWLSGVGARTLYIEPGSPWANGYVESFNGKLGDELLDREVSTRYWRCRC